MMPCNDSSSTKRCRLAPHGAAESWASLHQDLLELIAWRVLAGDLRDYVRFRAVCAHWNSSTVRPHGRSLVDPRFHPRCWMLFPEGHGLYPGHPILGGYVRFFNLSGRQTADPQNCRYRYMTEDMKLIYLDAFLRGVSAAVAVTVMLGLNNRHRVAYATAGDEGWSLSSWKLQSGTTVSSQGKLYATAFNYADNDFYVCQIDPPQLSAEGCHMVSLLRPRKIVKCPQFADMCIVYLAHCGSENMLIGFHDTEYEHPAVYKLSNIIKGRVAPTTNIEEHAIFIGAHCLCVSAKWLPSISTFEQLYRLPT
ncbi:hypothetical protein BS78_03G328000 [Paspalum vaginatum]|nr:hypothetical protein BS78_03G328000 [Paspalum vaginatum]